MRIGSVPYLNAKPLVDWFHSEACDAEVSITYAVPSRLAEMLRNDEIDVANCSIFEGFQQPGLVLLPGMSISAYGAVKSVRLFSKVPLPEVRSVALDTSSLTSAALTKVLLRETFCASPEYRRFPPNLEAMLKECDAGLLIGDLKLFDLHEGTIVYDLGQGWLELTGLPFVYAGWLAREDRASAEMVHLLTRARNWGVSRLSELAARWSEQMHLSLDRCQDYLVNVMNYDLTPEQRVGLNCFHEKCFEHELIRALTPLPILA